MRISIIFTTAVLSLLLNTSSFGQKHFLLSDTTIIYRLDAHVAIFIDSTEVISIDQIVKPEIQNRFQQSMGSLTFGYIKSAIWLKINTKSLSNATHWYLEIPAPFLEYVDFYQLRVDSTWHHSQSGYYIPHSAREISHTGHVLPLEFKSDSSSTVYVRIAGRSPKTFPVFAMEREKFNEKVRYEDIGYGIFFGILFVMFFYNFFIYLSIKQKNYLLYICTIICSFFIFSSASGYAGKFLWPESPMSNFYTGRLSLGVVVIFLSIFTIHFLEVKQYSKLMYYVLLSLIPLAVVASILVATGTVSSAGNNLISIATILYMATGVVCRLNGNKIASYFIAAWTIYLIGGLLLTLRNSGFLPFNFWTTHFVEIGATLETIIIAFALGDQFRRLKKEKEDAQLLALKVQQEATEELELKVSIRTEQLSRANEELQSTLETNKLQTEIIENKNAELDSFFYRISHDLRGPISSLLSLSFLAKIDVKDKQALDYIEKQHQQVERLNNIITGLMNLATLNRTDLQRELIDFHKIIDDCIGSFDGLENFASVSFVKNIQPGIKFYSEWTLLNAILQNLIENAIKYSKGPHPYVKISARQEGPWIILEVEDNGQGIPQKHQSKIFEMFFRATQNATGTGLGLYILKRSVDKLKGTIDFKSEVEVGSRFTVKLPVNLQGE
ncbi:MAG TPA: sensor histidine kinase [Chryseolinea sp.]|nr:sensor histidine kinase [Chryseolinea sp.]